MEINFNRDKGLLTYRIGGEIKEEHLLKLRGLQASIEKGNGISILAIEAGFEGYESFEAMKQAFLLDKGWIGRAKKYALVSDQTWLRNTVLAIGALVPSLEFKAFISKDLSLAEQWLDQK